MVMGIYFEVYGEDHQVNKSVRLPPVPAYVPFVFLESDPAKLIRLKNILNNISVNVTPRVG